ncbi:Efflux pump terJ [Vanrija pseudolonga]|uniref:Efflux pump terJ n=1 Tax=Vanrija pseudolonga TaxID=143232 RepID=A0AAF0Y5Z9_9TREE|nr:Efflux pump terJ [Vanrija pseudolonga]
MATDTDLAQRPSATPTLMDAVADHHDNGGAPKEKVLAMDAAPAPTPHTKPHFSQTRKWVLMSIFALAMFIDVMGLSAFYVLTQTVAADLNIKFEQQSWVITSYAVTFAAFLLLWGRVSDLYSATPVFNFAFIALGVLSLVISFLPDKYSFFVFRAIAGIAGGALVPASYRLIVYVFEPSELALAFTVYGVSGTMGNMWGTIFAGFIEYIPHSVGTQMQSCRWYFRITAIIIAPLATASLFLTPYAPGDESHTLSDGEPDPTPRWRRLDLVGALTMLTAIVLLTLGLTLGASYGWKKAGFLVPFLLSFPLFIGFFFWEAHLEPSYALIPASTWRIPNLAIFIAMGLPLFAWWAVNFLALIETFVQVYHERPIIAGVRMLPQAVVSLFLTAGFTYFPLLISRPWLTVLVGEAFCIVGYILFTRTSTFVGKDYWRFIFTGGLLGSGGNMTVFTAANVGIMTAIPPEMAGVAGALFQVAIQLGAVVGFATQAGMLTINPGGIANPANVHASFYFQMGWNALWLILFAIVYKRPKKSTPEPEPEA